MRPLPDAPPGLLVAQRWQVSWLAGLRRNAAFPALRPVASSVPALRSQLRWQPRHRPLTGPHRIPFTITISLVDSGTGKRTNCVANTKENDGIGVISPDARTRRPPGRRGRA